MGRFQILLLLAIGSCQFTIGWSMLQMSFGRLIPEYECVIDNLNTTAFDRDVATDVCKINGTSCSSYNFLTSRRTVSSEWLLLCDRKWIQGTIISVQMAGVLIGALAGGQLSDVIGRKKTLYSFLLTHVILNVIAGFSNSWQMFCALRFFIGIAIGAILVICCPYPMEFLPIKWRPIVGIIPTWSIGMGAYTLSAVLLDDWSYLHFACAIVSAPSLLWIFFVPESMRWLTLHCHLKQAHQVVEQMAKWNKNDIPQNTKQILKCIEQTELEVHQSRRMYSFQDLFKGFKQTRVSVSIWFIWFCISVAYYGISFGVASLHGNIFINILLLGVLEIPVQTTTFCTNNKFGRKPSSIFFFFASCLITLGCLLSRVFLSGDTEGISINVLSMIVKTMIGSAWSCMQVWSTELYPTVTRNLGYGFASSGARVGGILAPFIINFKSRMLLSYGILTAMFFVVSLICYTLPETKGNDLKDSQTMGTRNQEKGRHSTTPMIKL